MRRGSINNIWLFSSSRLEPSVLLHTAGNPDLSISCSHGRAHDYFIESINSNCHFYSHACNSFADYEKGLCHGCPSSGCPEMGFNANKTSARGSYYVSTAQSSPYCGESFVCVSRNSADVCSFIRTLHTCTCARDMLGVTQAAVFCQLRLTRRVDGSD